METTAYYAFGVPIYLFLFVVESLAARRRKRPLPRFADCFGNVSAGVGAIVIGLFLGPLLIALYDWAHAHFALVAWSRGSWPSWLIAIVLADFGHYWHHRLDHRVALFWSIHGVHHQPEEMNFTVGMRHAWFSDLYSFPFYAPLPLLGVTSTQFFVATTILSLHALLTHSAEYDFPSLGLFVTPRSHIVHHAKNPRYLDKNFGAMLSIWDRLFGTHVDLDPLEPPVYGSVRGYETHDGALSQWVLVRDLLALVTRAPTLRDKLRVLVSRPGWHPPNIELPALEPPRPSAAIPLATKLRAAVLSTLTVTFSLYVFILRDRHPWPFQIAAALLIIAGLSLSGAMLDGRLDLRRLVSARA